MNLNEINAAYSKVLIARKDIIAEIDLAGKRISELESAYKLLESGIDLIESITRRSLGLKNCYICHRFTENDFSHSDGRTSVYCDDCKGGASEA